MRFSKVAKLFWGDFGCDNSHRIIVVNKGVSKHETLRSLSQNYFISLRHVEIRVLGNQWFMFLQKAHQMTTNHY